MGGDADPDLLAGDAVDADLHRAVDKELADRGEIEPDSLHYLLNRNVLTRGLGLQDEIEVDLVPVDELSVGETFLLC